jgi:hypothetical protein
MQKLLTATVDAKQLVQGLKSPFTITEVEGVNELLEQGWVIEEWDFLKEDAGDGVILLIVILNDTAMYVDAEEQDELLEEFGFEEELSEEELDELEEEIGR